MWVGECGFTNDEWYIPSLDSACCLLTWFLWLPRGLQLHFSAFLFLQYRDVLFLTLSNPFSSILQSLHINFHKLEFPRFTILHFQFGVADLFPSSEFNYVQW